MIRFIKYQIYIVLLILFSYNKTTTETSEDTDEFAATPIETFYKAVDISYYPSIEKKGLTFLDRKGNPKAFLQILKENQINTIRLRLWHTPKDSHASFKEVESFSKQLKNIGFKVCLTVHYSDYWADPGKQVIPEAWKNLSFAILKDSMYNYTSKIMDKIRPDIIQIGNEIDPGFLLPIGDINTQKNQFLELLRQGISAVRNHNKNTKIMIHKAVPENASWFFDIVKPLDYDLIGVSFYPQWHGKNLSFLKTQLENLTNKYPQKLVLAETSYPFTLSWNDKKNNVVGDNSQIIFPKFPATLEGQKAYFVEIKKVISSVDKAVGFAYWGAEWVAFNGANATTTGSTWENQALFDFNLKATPALEVFKD